MNKNTNALSNCLSKQISWLQTWKTNEGAYNGFVVHRYDLKRMFKIHDTPWSQGPIINGYINLFNKTKDQKWLKEAVLAANLQCKRQQNSGEYIYAGFEDDRFSSLVHNSLANCALLDLVKVLKENNKNASKYLETARKNIDDYLIGQLWDENFGAFKFSKIDYYSPENVRFVVNMNSVAVESLIKLYYCTGELKYQEYALKVGEWILTEQTRSNTKEDGGIAYSQIQPRVLIAIYTALAMRGLDDLYYLTEDEKYLQAMKKAADHLINMKDDETKLFNHAFVDGKLVKYPQFIAGSGIILKALYDAEKVTNIKYNYEDILNTILDSQLPNGGFPNFVGYTKHDKSCKNDKTKSWEDIMPTVGWNAHLFEFLSRMVDPKFSHDPGSTTKSLKISNKNCYLIENEKFVCILSLKNIRRFLIYFAFKKMKNSLFYISTYHFIMLLKLFKR